MTTLNIDTQVKEESAEPDRDSAREQGASLVRRAAHWQSTCARPSPRRLP